MRRVLPFSLSLLLLTAVSVRADEPVDLDAVSRIRAEGLHRSQVMDVLQHLTDTIGPRLTGSPGMKKANEWTRDQLAEWGLEGARLEPWGTFGRGWSFRRVSVHMTSPQATPLRALPRAWTPGTEGPARGLATTARLEEEKDFEKYRGKLGGKVVLLSSPRSREDAERPPVRRFSAEELDELMEFPVPAERRSSFWKRAAKRYQFRKALNDFLVEEKALATLAISSRDDGIVRTGGGGSREPGESVGVPSLTMSAHHYNWLHRLLDAGEEVELEVEVDARFHDDDLTGYNTVAELPGSDKGDEVVMVGAHLDSWHPAHGSNDNAAGVAVAMEAVRILKAAGLEPRRTIRVALWSGEEQGLLGSRGYVSEHFASRPESEDPEQLELPAYLREPLWPITPKPEHETFSAYFNLDNGSGKIRGIYSQENMAVRPIFEAWLEPFHDLGADTVTSRNTGGTDHRTFDAVGLPGFQFIQDRLDYSSRTHHTELDVYDYARREDLVQASVVMASFLYHAATRDELLPRKPMPRKPPEPKPEKKKDEEE